MKTTAELVRAYADGKRALGVQIRALRLISRMSTADLAMKANLSEDLLISIEAGHANSTIDDILAIGVALGAPNVTLRF